MTPLLLANLIVLVTLILIVVSVISWQLGNKSGQLKILATLERKNLLRMCDEWYYSNDGSRRIDLNIDKSHRFSLSLLDDGTVTWEFDVDGIVNSGQSTENEMFCQAFSKWAQESLICSNCIVFTEDGRMLIAGMELKLVNTERGEVALVNEHGTPLMAIWPKGSIS